MGLHHFLQSLVVSQDSLKLYLMCLGRDIRLADAEGLPRGEGGLVEAVGCIGVILLIGKEGP